MTILDKMQQLVELASEAESNVDYALSVKWRSNSEDEKKNIVALVENAKMLFSSNYLEGLEFAMAEKTHEYYHHLFDEALMMFPEFYNQDLLSDLIEPTERRAA